MTPVLADLAQHFHLAERQPVIGPVPAHLPGHRHHRLSQLGGRGFSAQSVITKLYLGISLAVIARTPCCDANFVKGILVIVTTERLKQAAKWALLAAVTVAVTIPLTMVGVPSAALFAALIVGIALALPSLAPSRMPRPAGIAAQGVLGVYIGTMVHRDAVSALGPDWPIVVAVAVATLVLSIVAGALLGLHRDVSPLTGSLALVAGGASGLVAIARELGGDDRVVAVVQYLRVALVTASMPVVVTLIYHADRSHHAAMTHSKRFGALVSQRGA